jgi:hypothetical protein
MPTEEPRTIESMEAAQFQLSDRSAEGVDNSPQRYALTAGVVIPNASGVAVPVAKDKQVSENEVRELLSERAIAGVAAAIAKRED